MSTVGKWVAIVVAALYMVAKMPNESIAFSLMALFWQREQEAGR